MSRNEKILFSKQIHTFTKSLSEHPLLAQMRLNDGENIVRLLQHQHQWCQHSCSCGSTNRTTSCSNTVASARSDNFTCCSDIQTS